MGSGAGPLVLRSPRLHLRPFTGSDAAAIFRCVTPSLTRFMAWEPPSSPQAFAAVWRHWLPAMELGTEIYLVVRRSEGQRRGREDGDQECLGLIGLHDIGSRRPELGLWIKETAQHQGYGREALTLVAGWASSNLAPEGFIYPVAEQNIPSRKLAEALGGQVTGFRPGQKYNAVIYHIPRVGPFPGGGALPPN
ncbi:MAG TPA: GNAT family N-acetyltransferase [Terriglobia bacterium]|nr:GNAT family N-acetyltransferase [Terriglobia bacterium]